MKRLLKILFPKIFSKPKNVFTVYIASIRLEDDRFLTRYEIYKPNKELIFAHFDIIKKQSLNDAICITLYKVFQTLKITNIYEPIIINLKLKNSLIKSFNKIISIEELSGDQELISSLLNEVIKYTVCFIDMNNNDSQMKLLIQSLEEEKAKFGLGDNSVTDFRGWYNRSRKRN